MMTELAFNLNGDRFDVPSHAVGWRVRRLRPNRGAPEIVYDRSGRPLMLAIDADIDDLREAAKVPARYRLDPVNVDELPVEGVPSAYVQLVPLEEPNEKPREPSPADAYNETIREAMRLNTGIAQSVIERFPEMLTAASTLLRAADAAGLAIRPPMVVDEGVQEDSVAPQAPEPQGLDLNAMIAQGVAQGIPQIVEGLLGGKFKLSNLAALLDWRKARPSQPTGGAETAPGTPPSQAAPETTAAPAPATAPAQEQGARPRPKARPAGPAAAAAAAPAPTAPATVMEVVATLDPATMMHFVAIQSALTPQESQLAQAVAQELEPAQLRAWIEELTKLDIPSAVARIRDLLARMGGAS